MKRFLEAGCSGKLLGHPPLLYVSGVGPGPPLVLCSPAPRGKGAPHLLPAAPRSVVYVQLGCLSAAKAVFSEVTAWQACSQDPRPYLRKPSACTCPQVGMCSLPSPALEWAMWQHTMAPNGALCFPEIAEDPQLEEKTVWSDTWVHANIHQRKIQIINACTCSFSRSEYKVQAAVALCFLILA